MHRAHLAAMSAVLGILAFASIGHALGASLKAGTTLQASKTIDICALDQNTWRYSGVVSVWNEGNLDTQGLTIHDCIQNKVSGPTWASPYCQYVTSGGTVVIPALTFEVDAIPFPYSFTAAPLPGSIRNDASVTITNHSAHIGKPFGPEPKATWFDDVAPCATCGCVQGQGYWVNHTNAWPAGFDPNAFFFNSGVTWLEALAPPQNQASNGYYNLSKQYIPAVLNQANGACVPAGVQDLIDRATDFFSTNGTAAATCPSPSSCGLQKTWAATLETFNEGTYPGGPSKCGV
jgi:hypothetical protein